MTEEHQERYQLQKRLGAGAMGEVWLGTDTLLNRPVAIKYLKASGDARIREMFLAEARALASLNHPNITQIYDAKIDPNRDTFYLVMEYVEGESLEDIINGWSGAFPLEITLDIIIGVVEALEYAHQQGIVHRDIKPANVMMRKDGVKLTDFGIAGLISLLADGSDFIAGTPAYISPEQIDGVTTDGRADLYSLGVMLYELTSGGVRPFPYKSQTQLFMAHLDEAPADLKQYSPQTPLSLERTIMRLLEKSPDKRYASASELLDVLQAIKSRLSFDQPYLQLLDPDGQPLVGRDTEFDRLDEIWVDVQESGTPHLLIVEGPTGIGKTKLISEFLGRQVIDQGFIALAGRCDEAGIPYDPFADIFGTILNRNLSKTPPNQTQLDELLNQIPGLARTLNIADVSDREKEAPRKPPPKKRRTSSGGLWQALTERVPASDTGDFSETQWQFSKTVLDILSELGPTVLFLEDAIYLDEASISLIRFLVRRDQLPLLVIAACRTGDGASHWPATFSAEEKSSLTLRPLTTVDIETYATNLLGGSLESEVVALIEERSQGNPFSIEEVCRQLVDNDEIGQDQRGLWQRTGKEQLANAFLPQSVLGAFQRRIDKLSDKSRQALALAAILEPGPEFDVAHWTALLGHEMPEQDVAQVLKEGLKQRLIRDIGQNRYAFRPADVSKALAATLTGTRRAELHQQLAGLLQQSGADPLLVGHHHEQGGSPQTAAQFLEAAGAKAMAKEAINAALSYYSRAATLNPSATAYRAIGRINRQQGNHEEAIEAYEKTLVHVQTLGDATEEAHVLNSLSLTYCLNDQHEKAQRYAENVLKLDSASAASRAIAKSQLGLILWQTGQLAEAENWCQQAIQSLAGTEHPTQLAEAYSQLGIVYRSQGQFKKARLAWQNAQKIYEETSDQVGIGQVLNHLGHLTIEMGNFEQAGGLLRKALEIFKQHNARDGDLLVYLNEGRLLIYQQRPDKALPYLTKALDVAREINKHSAYIIGEIYRLMAQAMLGSGDVERAKSAADDAHQLAIGAGHRELMAQTDLTLAHIYQAQNNFTAAAAMFKNGLDLFRQVGSRPGVVRAKWHTAQFLRRQGQTAEADRLQDEAELEAEAMGLYLS